MVAFNPLLGDFAEVDTCVFRHLEEGIDGDSVAITIAATFEATGIFLVTLCGVVVSVHLAQFVEEFSSVFA